MTTNRYVSLVCVLLLVVACGTPRASAEADGTFQWTISTISEIDAPPSRVWRTLVDLPAYKEWNPFIVEASGEVAVGQSLALRMKLPGHDPMLIEPRLLAVEPERELRWRGQLLIPGLFDGEHVFELVALPNERTQLRHWERFEGLLLPIARRVIYDDTVSAFHALNAALAARSTLAGN